MIRANTVNPATVDTDMAHNDASYALFAPDLNEQDRTRDNLAERFQALNALPVAWVEPVDIPNVVLVLASDEARYITGVTCLSIPGLSSSNGSAQQSGLRGRISPARPGRRRRRRECPNG